MLLRGREEIHLEIPRAEPNRKFCQSHRKFRKQALKLKREKEQRERIQNETINLKPPQFSGKNEYLYYVGANDCVKEEVRWRYGLQLVQNIMETEPNPKKKNRNRAKRKSNKSKTDSTSNSMTKVERKALLDERKRMLKTAWSSASDESDEETNTDMPNGLKKFTIEDRKIILQKLLEFLMMVLRTQSKPVRKKTRNPWSFL